MPTQPLGWFKKPITKTEDFKGLKFRTVGLSIDMFTGMGAAVNALPGGEIVPAMDRGLLDAAEFNNTSSDRVLGFPDVSKVCMLQSFHQSAEQFEILFNKTKYDALPPKLQGDHRQRRGSRVAGHVLEGDRPLLEGLHRAADSRASSSTRRPTRSCSDQLKIWDEIVAKKAAENPMFKKVIESQRAFAERASQVAERHQRRLPHGRATTTSAKKQPDAEGLSSEVAHRQHPAAGGVWPPR